MHEVRTLGVGSFGRVKYGKYKGDGNMYAVKFMKKHEIIKLKQVDHINGERTLMQQVGGGRSGRGWARLWRRSRIRTS